MLRQLCYATALSVAIFPAYAQDTDKLREELRQLRNRIEELEKRLEQKTEAAPPAQSR